MSREWPEAPKPYIFRAIERSLKLSILSPIASWFAHRDADAGRFRRCAGAGCEGCAMGLQRMSRAVVLCIDSQGRECVLYLTERNRKVFDEHTTAAGLVVMVRKLGPASNSPLEITAIGHHDMRIRDIRPMVASWDLAPRSDGTPSLEVVA